MRINGLSLVIQMATRELDHPLINQYERAIILGSFREDVWYIPWIGKVVEHLSLTHFYGSDRPGGFFPWLTPGARLKANIYFRKAIREFRYGRHASSFVYLGRVSHLLTDMACPVHVHRVVHSTDPFEWYVEGNRSQLSNLPINWKSVENSSFKQASDIVTSLSQFTERFVPDRTNHFVGRVLRRFKLRKSLQRSELAKQAEQIIPVASAHMVELYKLFLRNAQGV